MSSDQAVEMTFLCPRRGEAPAMFKQPESDHLLADSTCSYCGSLDGNIFMERLEAGTIYLEGSDKNYKTYVRAVEGTSPILQTYRIDDNQTGDQSKWVWETKPVEQGKFYFMHLSRDQMQRFVELWNEARVKGLYVLPYFMGVRPK